MLCLQNCLFFSFHKQLEDRRRSHNSWPVPSSTNKFLHYTLSTRSVCTQRIQNICHYNLRRAPGSSSSHFPDNHIGNPSSHQMTRIACSSQLKPSVKTQSIWTEWWGGDEERLAISCFNLIEIRSDSTEYHRPRDQGRIASLLFIDDFFVLIVERRIYTSADEKRAP